MKIKEKTMKIIVVKNQKEFDNLPKKFDEYTRIEIRSVRSVFKIKINFKTGNSSVVAWGNSSVEARGNSSVEARGNSSVEAWENSSVEAWENSSVVAWGNSSVVATGNSSVVAWENSSVVAWENSSVVARENSSVVAWENSSVVARGNSSVEARGNSSVEAWENSVIRIFSNIRLKLNQFSVGIGIGIKIKAEYKSGSATLINKEIAKYDKKLFLRMYKKNIQKGGEILLYKSVKDDNTDFYSGKIKYIGKVICPDWDDNPNRECGGGLHLSPTPELAKSFNNGKIKKCIVEQKNFVVYPKNIDKVRCKEVEVIED